MELKIVELAHQRGLTMSDIAKRIGISRVNLSSSLNGNPTLSRLKEVAAILNVEVSELFKTSNVSEINGYVEYNGKIIKIDSKDSLTALVNEINAEQK
jgi:transcriptional regulator with XRE-family HTH domain